MSSEKNVAQLMPYTTLGRSGLRVSRLSYGAWVTFGNQIQVDEAYELMKLAYANGVNFFDNAEVYSSGKAEEVMGAAIKRGVENGDWERSDLVVTTKIFFGVKNGPNARGLSRKHIVEGTVASLKRLQLDYVDVVFCHRPDLVTPIEETVRAMNHVLDRGMAFYWGTSEWSAQEITEAHRVADKLGLVGPICDQPQYNMFERQRVEMEYLPLYSQFGTGLTTWSPLASGVLTGKYSGKKIPEGSRLSLKSYEFIKNSKFGNSDWQITRTDELKPIADELGCSLAQLAVAWCLKNEHVSTVLLGATKVHQLTENLAALEVLEKLTPDVLARIEGVLQTKPEMHGIHQQVTRMRQYPPAQ
ncbi:voltage-gated potassium channel subunit beta-1 [Salpingoeca rosetta]|uniref:Voltage-gated potassium channel subunit beta-1 n=1 Tax=Salpingoeca rosetta (strain ATCC 50818 / BSB-021) TaxID=946362 RepID=F2UQW9_SALR5|nr:voltage-gated potassium channel subunit beta-1 [Salpingoeca rosetta]EGD80024.1 voltage-gated potassium channel subunit beta-1 [Salpingoeca rosetta]ULM60677.1 KvbetaA [Salpingoeca rosetta]|eukprot:XP_004988349.1 voltage-gated potassium channel subunit beta-1 [Salpingoeca rosetta]